MKRVVISLHGIRTTGQWQKALVPLLARRGWVPHALDYGRRGIWVLFSKSYLRRKANWLNEEYQRIVREDGCERPSIIAHSFGSAIVAEALTTFRTLYLDKLILCGSLLPIDYPWDRLFSNHQLNCARDDRGGVDRWSRIGGVILWKSRARGSAKFRKEHRRLDEPPFDNYGHSHFFHEGHFDKEWIPYLEKLVVGTKTVEVIRNLFAATVTKVGARLGARQSDLRMNVFIPQSDETLQMAPDLHFQIPSEEEQNIRIPQGTGCTGLAYKKRFPMVAIFRSDWGNYALPDGELRKVDPRLRWIVSFPVSDPSSGKGEVFAVVNVDGLNTAYSVEKLTEIVVPAAQEFSERLRGILEWRRSAA